MRIRDEYLHGSDLTGVVKKIEVTTGTGNNANKSVIKYIKADSEGGVVEVPIGDITGKAATASKLDNTSAIGSKINPVYFTNKGVPSACTYSLNATVPAGAANKVLYYSAANTLDVQSYATLTSNLDVFTVATASANGKKGLVPAPSVNQLGAGNFFLRADGVWTVIENKTAVLNGTATSLVTTGEKYNWNSAYNWYNSMTSGDTDGVINKWKEVEAFLANYGDSSTLAAELAKLVTLSTDQTITGIKTFSEVINGSITGNAETADKLKNTVNINGVAFDGSSDITITAAANGGNADTVDGKHASDFYQYKYARSNQDSIYDLRWNYGPYNKGDFNGTYKDEYPTYHGRYLALTSSDKNSGALMFFDTPVNNELGHIYVRTRGAGDGNTTYSELGTLAYLTDNVASADYATSAGSVDWSGVTNKPSSFTPSSHTHTKSQITDFPSSLPASDVYAWAKASTKPSYSWAEITSKPTTLSGYGITDAVNIAGGVMTGTLASNGGHYIGNPEGGSYYTATGSVTGCITITLPAGVPNTMVSMWVDVYNYEYNLSFSVHLGGYTYNEGNTWINSPFAMVYGAQHKVRLGYDGTHFVIYIGETTSVWSYPQISVRDVTLGFKRDVSAWRNAWSIGFSTTLQNVTVYITNYAYTNNNLTASVIGNLGTLSNDISGNAATATNVDWSGVTNRPTNVSAFTNDAGYLTSHAYSYGSIDIYDINGAKKTSNNTVSASVNTETLRLQEGSNISITATNSGDPGSDVIKIAVTGIESNINQNGYGQLALWYNGAPSVSTTLQSSTYNEILTVKAGSGIDFNGYNGADNNDIWTISAIPYNCAITLNNNSTKSLIKDSWSADKDSVYLTSDGTSGGTYLAAGTYALWIEDRSSDSGTPNYYSGTFTCAGNATAGRLDEIALHSSMATIADTNAPTRIFVATLISSDSSNTPGKHVLRFCSLDSKATPHYLTVKVNRII